MIDFLARWVVNNAYLRKMSGGTSLPVWLGRFRRGPMESPFKGGVPSPWRSLPGGDDPQIIKHDLMHNFNLGVGGDLAVSTLVGMCRMGAFDEQGCAIGLTHGARGTITPQPSSALSSKNSKWLRPYQDNFKNLILLFWAFVCCFLTSISCPRFPHLCGLITCAR